MATVYVPMSNHVRPELRRQSVVRLKVTGAERAALEDFAKRSRRTLSSVMREAIEHVIGADSSTSGSGT